MLKHVVSCAALLLTASAAWAQMPYGAPINLEQAKKAMAAAEAEARKNKWPLAIAIVDTGGHLVMFQRLDNTQFGSVDIAKDKAYSSVALRRPTKALQDVLAKGGDGLRILHLRGATAVDGGHPIVVDGKIIGAIGASGAAGHEDAQVAKAGADALAAK